MKLAVLSVVENLYGQRKTNFNIFAQGMAQSKANLYVLEMSSNDVFTLSNVHHETVAKGLWHKECGLSYLLDVTRSDYVAWVDADVTFTHPDWINFTVDALEKEFKVVQMFSFAQNLDVNFRPLGDPRPGYYYQYLTEGRIRGGIGFKPKKFNIPQCEDAHPGLAWAAHRDVLEAGGGFLDWNIMSGGDFMMAAAFIGKLTSVLKFGDFSDAYVEKCKRWEDAVDRIVDGRFGYLPGIVHHYYHGPAKRKYHTPSETFQSYKFDPDQDIKKDPLGFYQFTENNPELEKEVREYVEYRNKE